MARIALYSLETVGKQMAGPGIRYWEFAKALSKSHDVTLFTPNISDLTSTEFAIKSYRRGTIPREISEADILITQRISLRQALVAQKSGTKIILDAYDPIPLEALEMFKSRSPKAQVHSNAHVVTQQNLSFLTCDAVICASEKQRDLWLGTLMALHRLTPDVYAKDPSLRCLIDVVPFGLPTTPPKKSGPGLREHFGFKSTDKVVLWGGGIWNWFDPLSLIHAIHHLSQKRSDIKLVFMGVKLPSDTVPEMEMGKKALDLAKELNLLDRHVFFNFGWVPYENRQNYLLEADIGASTHFEHLETRYSFRTRMLDYMWCELPILGTTGDSFADLIQSHNLGIVVPYQDSHAIANAIEKMVDDKKLNAEIKANLRTMGETFHWENLVKPLLRLTDELINQPPKPLSLSQKGHILKTYLSLINTVRKEKGLWTMIRQVGTSVARTCLPS